MKPISWLLLSIGLLTIGCSEEVKFDTQGQLPYIFTLDEEGFYNLKYITPKMEENKIDVLFFIDTSGSMAYEQEQIGSRLSSFISQFNDTSWRIGLSTTNIENDSNPGSNGRLINLNGYDFLTNSTPNAHSIFAENLKRPISCTSNCDNHERGIYNAVLAIQNKDTSAFFRNPSHIHFVFVSDEDENSDGTDLETNDLPQNLVQLVKNQLKPISFTAHSIINRPGDSDCLANEGSNYGDVYKEISDLTQGVVGDVCAADYSSQLSEISTKIRKKTSSFDLPCAPDTNELYVTFADANVSSNWSVSGNNLIFEPALPEGSEFRIKFKCN